jgi:hypothetical protein
MRRLLLLSSAVVAIVACTKTETPATDTSAAMAPAPAPAAPAAVSDADVSGTWSGVSMPPNSDSVVSHWTQVCAAGKCKGTSTEDPKVTINSTYTLAADSAVGMSEPFTNAAMVKNGKIIDTWVVHFMGDSATGTGAFKLASKPDSIVLAYRFAGAKKK